MIRIIEKIFISVFLLVMMGSCVASKGKIALKNLESFKQSMREALPVGIPKAKVDNYLDSKNISYEYFSTEKTYSAGIPKIGVKRLIFDAHLSINIKLDNDELLENIIFDAQYDGP